MDQVLFCEPLPILPLLSQKGAQKVEFMNNRIDHTMRVSSPSNSASSFYLFLTIYSTSKDAFSFENVKDLAFIDNMFGFSFSQPILKLVYEEGELTLRLQDFPPEIVRPQNAVSKPPGPACLSPKF